jgi:hypothetical protein
MTKYTVYLETGLEVGVKVEAADADEAIDKAYDERPGSICAQCSGWGQNWTKSEGDELEPNCVVDDATGETVWEAPVSQ